MTELWNAVRSVVRSQREGVPLERMSRDAPSRASFAQERIWFLEQLTPGVPLFDLTVALRLTGPLSVCGLEDSLTEILRRHESLRTTLQLVDGQLIQRIHPPPHFELPLADLRTMDEARRCLDLEKPPLMCGRLFRLGHEEHILELTVHHLAFDASSFDVFMRELCAIYRALVEGSKIPLNEPSFQYADFAAWQRKRMAGAAFEELLNYWSRQMAGPLPTLRLPLDRPRSAVRKYRGALQDLRLSKEQTEAMKKLCAQEKITPFMMLLAAFQALLYRYTGEEDVIVGSHVANRNRSEIQNMIGLFVNTVPLRTRVSGEMTFRQLLARVRDVVAGAYTHQELPFEMLLKAVDVPRQINGSPVFQVMFVYQNVPRSSWTIPGLTIDAWNIHNGTAKFDITFFLWEETSGICGHLEYDTDLFDDATTAQLVRHFSALVAEVVADPSMAIGVIPLLSAAETQRVLREWNSTTVSYPREHTVHQLFENTVRQFPNNKALVFDKVELTYRDLDRRANQLAGYLEKQGVRPGMLAGVSLHRSPELIVTLIAILKTGAAYVPVDPAVPDDYLNRLLISANVSVVITTDPDAGRLSESFHLLCLDTERIAIDRENEQYRSASIPSDNLAYVMHTSGSTGTPKGVCITHRGIVRLVVGANYVRLTAQDSFLQLASLSFDLSTFEIWGALLNGARLVIPSSEGVSLTEIGDIICRNQISVLLLTPAIFALLVETHLAELRNVPQVLVCGDVLSVPHSSRFLDQANGCRLINCYGPTENTTFTSFHDVRVQDCVDGGSIPIGRPVSNTVIYVLDKDLQPVPAGVSGEAYTGGDGLMRGYLDDPELTRQRMIANPFSDDPHSLLYKTGDLVRQRRDGTLEFLGRIDNQCKIRGFRVEPDEVAAAINTCPEVRSVEVLARDTPDRGKRLIAYVVPGRAAGSSKDLISHIRHYVRERLPEYLVPSEFVLLETLPLNRNGKVDRGALPVPQYPGKNRPSASAQPRDDAEREVWMAFQHVLGIANIGIHDNFFELGGDSLMALRLFAILENSFSTRLPLVTLFEHPTVAELAFDVSRYSQRGGSALVEIKHGRTEMPLFFVPGGHGGMAEMTLYAKMMRHLSGDQTVYGLLAQPHRSITENAAFYVNEIRRVQPLGPYTLGGECVGGVIAFEIAQQLLAQGQRIAVLLLMDTWCPVETGRFRAILRNRGSIARSGFSNFRRLLRENIRYQPSMKSSSAWLQYWRDVARALAQKADAWKSALNNIENTMRYQPQPYPGQITLLISSRNDEKGLPKPWRALARDGVVVHTVQGDHESYIRDTPGATAEQLRICLEEATLRR